MGGRTCLTAIGVENARRAEVDKTKNHKKWGDDGHITSPFLLRQGRAHSVKKTAQESYHEHSSESTMNISIQSMTYAMAFAGCLGGERR